MVANVTVTNFNYTEELNDIQSETYRSFEEHFRSEVRTGGLSCPPPWPPCPLGGASRNPSALQIKKIYGTIPGYEGVNIISLR